MNNELYFTLKLTWFIILIPSFIASGFSMVASIIHFQTLAAMGFGLLSTLIYLLILFIIDLGE